MNPALAWCAGWVAGRAGRPRLRPDRRGRLVLGRRHETEHPRQRQDRVSAPGHRGSGRRRRGGCPVTRQVVSYRRVSTDCQAGSGLGLAAQEAKVRRPRGGPTTSSSSTTIATRDARRAPSTGPPLRRSSLPSAPARCPPSSSAVSTASRGDYATSATSLSSRSGTTCASSRHRNPSTPARPPAVSFCTCWPRSVSGNARRSASAPGRRFRCAVPRGAPWGMHPTASRSATMAASSTTPASWPPSTRRARRGAGGCRSGRSRTSSTAQATGHAQGRSGPARASLRARAEPKA